MRNLTVLTKKLTFLSLLLLIGVPLFAQELYWIDGPGDWDDPMHWSKRPGNEGVGPAGNIPDLKTDVFIDEFSGLKAGDVLNLPAGDHFAKNLLVTSQEKFILNMAGAGNNNVALNVFADLLLSEKMELTYAGSLFSENIWKFAGSEKHNIVSASQDLSSVEFIEETATFNQLDNLKASRRIRMYGGTWNTDGHEVRSDLIFFQDNNSSANPLTKTFNTSGSQIFAKNWYAKFVYGSLTVNGSHQIFTEIFDGNPRQVLGANPTQPRYDRIYLLELSDETPSSSSVIEYNNFECNECIVNQLIIEDTGDTRLANAFTITDRLVVRNEGSVIKLNGGNSRSNNMMIEGIIVTPEVNGCTGRTVFTSVHSTFATFTRATGTLTVSDAVMESIQAEGGATFQLDNGILAGASSGWTITTPPTALEYMWIGPNSSFGNWDDPNNWRLTNGDFTGCLPTITDNVLINSEARSSIRIPSDFEATCNNFTWTNKQGLELRLDGGTNAPSELTVAGSFELSKGTIINGVNSHELNFSSTTNNSISTANVVLPEIQFSGSGGWELNDPLTCSDIKFDGGTLNTRNNDIVTDRWFSVGDAAKTLTLGSTHLLVNGALELTPLANSNLTVNAGTSLVECESLETRVDLHDVKLNNTTTMTLARGNDAVSFNKLILAGSGEVRTDDDLTVGELVFAADDATLTLNTAYGLTLTEGIESQTAAANPGVLKSRTSGTQASLIKPSGNLCAMGPVIFQDVEATVSGVFNAPQGVDDGNNTGIDFTDASASQSLYWIGGTGQWGATGNWAGMPGGCPATTTPATAMQLTIDDSGLYADDEVITLSGNTSCRSLIVNHSQGALQLIVDASLTAERLEIIRGQVELQGEDIEVTGEAITQSISALSIQLQEFLTPKLTNNGGLIIVEDGSTIIIEE